MIQISEIKSQDNNYALIKFPKKFRTPEFGILIYRKSKNNKYNRAEIFKEMEGKAYNSSFIPRPDEHYYQ
jgi:hypothetical protein